MYLSTLSRPGQGDGEPGVGGRERVLCELQRVPQAHLHQEAGRAGPGHADGGLQVAAKHVHLASPHFCLILDLVYLCKCFQLQVFYHLGYLTLTIRGRLMRNSSER